MKNNSVSASLSLTHTNTTHTHTHTHTHITEFTKKYSFTCYHFDNIAVLSSRLAIKNMSLPISLHRK